MLLVSLHELELGGDHVAERLALRLTLPRLLTEIHQTQHFLQSHWLLGGTRVSFVQNIVAQHFLSLLLMHFYPVELPPVTQVLLSRLLLCLFAFRLAQY